MKETRIIHRYKIRALYDTKGKKDIIFKDIVGFIKNGENVRIFEKETKKDVTSDVLCRLIAKYSSISKEQAQLKILHNIIESGDSSLQSWCKQHFLGEELEKVEPKFALTNKERATLVAKAVKQNRQINVDIIKDKYQTINLPLGVNNEFF